MNRHLFIAPADIRSPRWLQAFPTAVVGDGDSVSSSAGFDLVWIVVRDHHDFSLFTAAVARERKIIALTLGESVEQARAALEAGASGYVHFLAAPAVLEQVAMVVTAGGMWLGADLMRQLVFATSRSLMSMPVAPGGVSVDLSQLTSRELAVARLVAAGKTNKEVARELDITERTVKAHLGSAFEKLKARDRLHLVLMLASNKNH
jgi:DNA-binding NarL/FixJ family response regulator